jgi:hypothetical protein
MGSKTAALKDRQATLWLAKVTIDGKNQKKSKVTVQATTRLAQSPCF